MGIIFSGTYYSSYDDAAFGHFQAWALGGGNTLEGYLDANPADLAKECTANGWFAEFEAEHGALRDGAVNRFAERLVASAADAALGEAVEAFNDCDDEDDVEIAEARAAVIAAAAKATPAARKSALNELGWDALRG